MAARRRRKNKAPETLTQALSRLLSRALVPDLQGRAKQASVDAVLRARHGVEKQAGRTGEAYPQWRDGLLEQVGAAWVLSCVFVRTLEDRGLVAQRRLAGPGARDSEQLFFELFPNLTARDYLLSVFGELGRLPGARELLGQEHNLAWRLSPSADGARALLDFFREADPEVGSDDEGGAEDAPRWRFEPSGAGSMSASTRFLGDLYQDLSESVRKRYALLQTPDFVESFILDRTLEPAIEQVGAAAVRVIDPTCGSGHFLLGAFERVLGHLRRERPGEDGQVLARQALGRVYGVDVNPYAVAIARFRLTLAYLEAAGWTRLDQIGEGLGLERQVIVADSLLHRIDSGTQYHFADVVDEDSASQWRDDLFNVEDTAALKGVLGQRYHAVVGNPPYITCKDSALRDAYREKYTACHRQYALSAPFTERFFELCVDEGYTGLIVANSFMKRSFGTKLIEEVLPKLDVTQVVDTSGAYIPGHGTPTVILFGRNRKPIKDTVLATLGKRGEPSTPSDPAEGEVWSSIRDHAEEVDFENDYISVDEVPRERFDTHPWTLQGGGASKLKELIESRAPIRLVDVIDVVGYICMTRADDLYFAPPGTFERLGIHQKHVIENVEGEKVRDWGLATPNENVFPYDERLNPISIERDMAVQKFLWPHRETLWRRREPNGDHRELGKTWWEWSRFQTERFTTPLSIAFAFVATHNHFVLDRGGKVFKQSAPIIKLPEGATEDEHLALLGYLNSSTACFWMKQVFYPKSSAVGDVSTVKGREEDNRYEFAGTGLQALPLPDAKHSARLVDYARRLDDLAQRRGELTPAAVLARWDGETSLVSMFESCMQQDARFERYMIAVQEELDWYVYSCFGLAGDVPDDLLVVPEVEKEQRPFAWAGDEPPKDLPPELVERYLHRKKLTSSSRALRLLEGPVFKRRWRGQRGVFGHKAGGYMDNARDAASAWLLDAVERALSNEAQPMTARELAVEFATQSSFAEVAAFWTGESAPDLTNVISDLMAKESVPYLAALRYRESGMEKRAQWERTWALQRREDAGESVEVPVPPKYGSKDFRSTSVYRLRGKLDVPKERFVSYPGAESDEGGGALYGWAGWDHLERAQALAGLFMERKGEGWPAGRLTPLLAGLLELVPWLEQWHDEATEFGQSMGRYFRDFVESEAQGLGLSLDDLRAWRG